MKFKKLSLIIILISFLFNLNAQNKWTLLAGGTPDAGTQAPYFLPNMLTIELGDTVEWKNIEGYHNITTTSGPDDFTFAQSGFDWTHQFVFTKAGFYDYECSVGDHALTQFGTIQVVEDQKKYVVIAGGTPDGNTPAPYFSPNFLTIQQGDTIVWSNVEGYHNVTTTSGPDDFTFAQSGFDWTHQFVFTEVGSYDYECSVGDHALTQFGTIAVESTLATDNLSKNNLKLDIYPNPTQSIAIIEWNNNYSSTTKLEIVLTDILGTTISKTTIPSNMNTHTLDLSKLAEGIYTVSLKSQNKYLKSSRITKI